LDQVDEIWERTLTRMRHDTEPTRFSCLTIALCFPLRGCPDIRVVGDKLKGTIEWPPRGMYSPRNSIGIYGSPISPYSPPIH
jgi:hypothetical protein